MNEHSPIHPIGAYIPMVDGPEKVSGRAKYTADILQPERDRVRASGINDDPAGGVLDGAPDRLVIVWNRGDRRPAEAAAG